MLPCAIYLQNALMRVYTANLNPLVGGTLAKPETTWRTDMYKRQE